ncbi:translation initiation factor IF-2-like [Cebus imitator]|uniref:translation initiation factor IF-2-like n=1 Tax=Cebus imitator TaxID=2715852 RepID=UPI00189938A3|nr:translation initiation factor IF-2-like [Cebus imitator]
MSEIAKPVYYIQYVEILDDILRKVGKLQDAGWGGSVAGRGRGTAPSSAGPAGWGRAAPGAPSDLAGNGSRLPDPLGKRGGRPAPRPPVRCCSLERSLRQVPFASPLLGDPCSGGGGRRAAAAAAAAAAWAPGTGRRARGAAEAAAASSRSRTMRAAGAEPPGGCSCHEPRGRRGPRGRGAAGTPPPPALLSPAPSTSHFSEFPSRPRAAGGGGGLSCHGHQLGAAPRRGKSLQQRLLSASFPVALVSAERASIRGGGADCAAACPAWGAGARGRRGKREPEVGAGAPRPWRRRDLGQLAHLSESCRPGPRNGGDRGVGFGRRSPRRRWCLTPARLLAPSPGKGFRRSIHTNGNVTGTDFDDKIKDHQARSCSRQLCFQMKLPTFKISTYSKLGESTDVQKTYLIQVTFEMGREEYGLVTLRSPRPGTGG